MIPGFLECFSAADADVEDEDGAAGFTGEHYRARLGDVTRAARAINREGAIHAFLEAASHHSEAAETAT